MQHDVKTSSLVIACFDGHGQFGHDVSRFCKIFMERELVAHHLFLSDLHQAILDVTAQLGMLCRERNKKRSRRKRRENESDDERKRRGKVRKYKK